MRIGCQIIQMGSVTAIVCGAEVNDHKCNDRSLVYEFSDGFVGTLFEKVKREKMNLDMCDDDKLFFLAKRDIRVLGCGSACSICGRSWIDEIKYL